MSIESELLGGRPLRPDDEWTGSSKLRRMMARATRERQETRKAEMASMSGADRIRAVYRDETDEELDRLRELMEDDDREAQGLARRYPRAAVESERHELRRRLAYKDNAHASRLQALAAEADAALAAARTKPVGDDQARIADLMEADALARTTSAADLLDEARARLALNDPRGAAVRLQAAKLASSGKPVRGISGVASAVEDALDRHVPDRRIALREHREARVAFADAAVERIKIAQLAALLAGDRSAAARASAKAKLQAYGAARAKGEPYSERVNLQSVNPHPE